MSRLTIEACTPIEFPHTWLPTTGKGLQCYSCPNCNQRIYWSEILRQWVKVNPKPKKRSKS